MVNPFAKLAVLRDCALGLPLNDIAAKVCRAATKPRGGA
jgi:hypothetical protein